MKLTNLEINKERWTYIFAGLLVYLTSFVIAPISLIYPIIVFIGLVIFVKKINYRLINIEEFLFVLMIFISILEFVVGYKYAKIDNSVSVMGNFIPYALMIICTIYFSQSLNDSVMYTVFYILILELLVGIGEFIIGIPYIFEPKVSEVDTEFGTTSLLYFNRVFGLSASVSVFAQKSMVALILLFYLSFRKRARVFYCMIIICSFIVSFNRTAILSSLFFLFAILLKYINWKYMVLILLVITYVMYINFDILLLQFFRGKSDIDLSGRDLIFPYYIQFITDNTLFGNFGHKLWFSYSSAKVYHAHNSYLQTLASLGLLPCILLVVYILRSIKKNFGILFFIFPIMIYSLFQFGVFWGVSFLDIIFFYLLSRERSLK